MPTLRLYWHEEPECRECGRKLEHGAKCYPVTGTGQGKNGVVCRPCAVEVLAVGHLPAWSLHVGEMRPSDAIRLARARARG